MNKKKEIIKKGTKMHTGSHIYLRYRASEGLQKTKKEKTNSKKQKSRIATKKESGQVGDGIALKGTIGVGRIFPSQIVSENCSISSTCGGWLNPMIRK